MTMSTQATAPAGTAFRSAGYVAGFMAVFVVAIGLSLSVKGIDWNYIDAKFYEAMASGHWYVGDPPRPVPEPFANRILVPVLAGFIAPLASVDPMTAMIMINAAALICLGLAIAVYFERKAVPLPVALAIAAMPIFGTMGRCLNTVDATFALLALLLVIATFENRRWQVAGTAFVAALTRTTVVAYYPFLLLRALLQRAWLVAAAMILAAVVASQVIDFVKPYETTNVHGLGGITYLALKLPINFIKNVFGFDFWTNTYAWCKEPFYKFSIPDVGLLGNIREIGICYPDAARPLNTLIHYACTLGIFPLLAIYGGRHFALPKRHDVHSAEIDNTICYWAFVIFFVTAVGYGNAADAILARVFTYALPWLIILLPRLPLSAWGWRPLGATLVLSIAYHVLVLAPEAR